MACTFLTSQPPKVSRGWVFFCIFDFEMCLAPQRRALFRHLNFQKCSESGVFYIQTSKCASRNNGVHFLNIATSKSGPNMVCFVHFDFQMCFGPQGRALFRQLNFQSGWTWGVFSFFTSKCASRYNGVQLFISHLARWPCTRRFSEPVFRPSVGKTQWIATFLSFRAPTSSSHSFSSLIFSPLLFSSLTLPTSAFPSVHLVGSLTSKLPPVNITYMYIYK